MLRTGEGNNGFSLAFLSCWIVFELDRDGLELEPIQELLNVFFLGLLAKVSQNKFADFAFDDTIAGIHWKT